MTGNKQHQHAAGTPLERITGRGVYVAGNDIDTDRIIPARFLKCVTFDELGPALFYDERFATDSKPADSAGAASNSPGSNSSGSNSPASNSPASNSPASNSAASNSSASNHQSSAHATSAHVKSKGHILDAPQHQGAEVLITDSNFGCGSSREHAPQAIQKFGFKAVIAGSFAEIFHGNCTTLGIPCLVMADADRHQLAADVQANPDEELICDLEQLQVIFANRIYQVQMKDSAREAFLNAAWDPLDTLLAAQVDISQVAAKLDYGSAA